MLRQKHRGIASPRPGLVHISPVYLTGGAAASKGAVALLRHVASGFPITPRERNRLPLSAKHSRNGPVLTSAYKRGDFKMITLKEIALVAGAGFIFATYSGERGPDVVLAIIACFS